MSAGERREGTFAVEWFSGGCVPMAGVRAASSASRSRQQWGIQRGRPIEETRRGTGRRRGRPPRSVSFIEPGRRRGANHRCEHPGELTVDSSAAPSRGTGTTDMWTRCSPAHMSVSAPQRWDFVQLLRLITIGW